MNAKPSPRPKNKEAEANRRLFTSEGTLAINVIGSSGCGKTTLLERTIEALRHKVSIGAIEADVSSSLDAHRLRELGIPVAQVITHGLCHLESLMVQEAMKENDLRNKELLFIENVGGVICPPTIDLGEALKIAVLSIAEEDTEPLKYPTLFENANILVINKIDLLQWVSYDLDAMKRHALALNDNLEIFQVSASMGHGLRDWTTWLLHEVRKRQEIFTA